MKDTIHTDNATNVTASEPKRVYRTPQMVEHGELTQLTKGAGASGADGLGYSVPI